MMRKLAKGGLVAGLVLLPLAVLAQTATAPAGNTPSNQTEEALLAQSKISMTAAGDMALKLHPGTLTEIGFNDEDGRGVYEAHVLDSAGKTWVVKVDAVSGETLASGDASVTGDEEMAANGVDEDDEAAGEKAIGTDSDVEKADDNGMTEEGKG